eukprot:TRINITY_DN4404_c0_g2_i1.p1 TRINITY_DN4404_c0_g2~~TRINITY_DN4404_c0_g2_i1.p1  ORF type:complete len:475 (+),score=163.96 TRINITY_DN4404_c0_g2_i1:68-1492(+)
MCIRDRYQRRVHGDNKIYKMEQGTVTIVDIKGREILDSRGNPTVEADVITTLGSYRAATPSGASTGIYEAHELRDEDKSRYQGKGVLKAVQNVNTTIRTALLNRNVTEQRAIDEEMVFNLDGSQNEYGYNKKNLGANAILPVSLAVGRAGAAARNLPLYQYIRTLSHPELQNDKYVLPVPAFNVINGGKHAGNKLAFQEFMILPTGAKTFREAVQIGAEVYQNLKKVINKKYGIDATNVGDEGGFAPNIQDTEEGAKLLIEAIELSGHTGKVDIGFDVAASEFYVPETKKYDLDFKNTQNDGSKQVTVDELLEIYAGLCDRYPIVSIEDPFDQDDFEAYKKIQARLGSKVQIVGDDLLVTNKKRINIGIEQNLCNALLLKVNQIGSLTESIEAFQTARSAGWGVMVSHRSGETEDCFIADLVVGLGTGQIKTGAPCRSERLAKYNQILRIEEELGDRAIYAGRYFKNPDHFLKQ